MKNVLIIAGIAGLVSAIAIYFVIEANKHSGELSEYDELMAANDRETYDYIENAGRPTIF